VVAESSTDTLTLTETSFLTLTGTAATDTIDITQVTTDLGTDGLIAANAVALTTDTSGNYVASVADGTGIDGTAAAEGATYTPTLDLTEISSLTWGAGAFTTMTFDAGVTDPVLTAASGTMSLNVPLEVDATDPADTGAIRLDNAETIAWEASPAGTDCTFGLTAAELLVSSCDLATTLDLTVTGGDITLGQTSIFSGGDTASLNNVDAIDATTETTLEAAIDALTVALGANSTVQSGTNPTVDAAGEVGVDTTAASGSMFRFYGDASYQLPGYFCRTIAITSATTASDAGIFKTPWALTIRSVNVLATGGTNVVGQLDECDANGANCVTVDTQDITATAGTNAADDGALSNPSIDAADYVGWHTTSVSGTNTRVMVTWCATVDAVN